MNEPENVVPFRRKLPPILWSDGRMQSECDDLVHLFASVPGRCQCGERTWDVAPGVVPEWADQPGIILNEREPE